MRAKVRVRVKARVRVRPNPNPALDVARLAAAYAATHRSRGPQPPAQGFPLGPQGEPASLSWVPNRGRHLEATAALWCCAEVAHSAALDQAGRGGAGGSQRRHLRLPLARLPRVASRPGAAAACRASGGAQQHGRCGAVRRLKQACSTPYLLECRIEHRLFSVLAWRGVDCIFVVPFYNIRVLPFVGTLAAVDVYVWLTYFQFSSGIIPHDRRNCRVRCKAVTPPPCMEGVAKLT